MNFQESIISALIPRSQAEKPLIDLAFQELAKARVPQEYFTGNYKILFDYIVKQNSHHSVLDRDILEARLSQEPFSDEEKNEVRILFSTCKEQVVSLEKFKELLPAFVDECGKFNLGNALRTSTQILTEGYTQGKIKLQGLTDARKYLLAKIAGIQSGFESEMFPQGNILQDMETLWRLYSEAENNPGIGILSGFRELDLSTRGARKGELWVVGGFMGEGKSQILRNFSYFASVFQKKNIVYATLEMPYRDLLTQFVSLHSTHPKFNNPFGIKANDIFNGTLSALDKPKLEEVAKDFETGDYGINYVLQMPFGSTVTSLREKLIYINSLFKVDALFLDYTALLKPEFIKQSTVAETTNIANDLKLTALSFNNGEGLPIIAAHQISRDSRRRAEENERERYDMAFLADSAGVERASDVIIWLLRLEKWIQQREAKMGMNKFRRGKVIPDFMLREYYDCSKLSSIEMEKEISSGDIHLID